MSFITPRSFFIIIFLVLGMRHRIRKMLFMYNPTELGTVDSIGGAGMLDAIASFFKRGEVLFASSDHIGILLDDVGHGMKRRGRWRLRQGVGQDAESSVSSRVMDAHLLAFGSQIGVVADLVAQDVAEGAVTLVGSGVTETGLA